MPALPSPKRLAWLLVRPTAELAAEEHAAVARATQDPEAARVAALARRFAGLVRSSGVGRRAARHTPLAALKAWLADASSCGVRAVATFAAGPLGLLRDISFGGILMLPVLYVGGLVFSLCPFCDLCSI